MNWVFQLSRGSLVGSVQALRIRFKINRYFAMAGDISGLLIVFELLSINLVKAGCIGSIDRNSYIVQFNPPALFELHRFARLNLKERSSLL